MGRVPQFAWTTRPTFVGFAVNVILSPGEAALSLPVLCGILNSSLAARWFAVHAKRRGVNLEINGGTLRRFPLPTSHDEPRLRRLETLVLGRHSSGHMAGSVSRLESEIDRLVAGLYGVEYALEP